MTKPQRPPHDAPGAEAPGDTQAPDIVGPTGEEMPEQTHDTVDGPPRTRPDVERPARPGTSRQHRP